MDYIINKNSGGKQLTPGMPGNGLNGINTYAHFKTYVKKEASFLPFQDIFHRHEWLCRLVFHEKSLSPSLHEERIVVDPQTNDWLYGTRLDTSMPIDEFYPGVFTPFNIKGIWLSLDEGQFFSTLTCLDDCPLINTDQNKILFLIHPHSETCYEHLLKQHQQSLVIIPALSLSSMRSLLVAIPDEANQYQPALVKLSLNKYSCGTLRVLTQRDCALSVANSFVFKNKLESMDPSLHFSIFEEPLAYIPQNCDYGFIYRAFPSLLHHENAPFYAIPLLSLYGAKNSDFFKTLVENQMTISSFLKECILAPFARIFVELLYRHQISIEAHGQNLMLVLDHQDKIKGLMYRDMGGVNLQIDPDDPRLPINLRQENLSYFTNHNRDACVALEYAFVGRALFPLTKQLVNNAVYFSRNDLAFQDWYHKMASSPHHYLQNWTNGEPSSDRHKNPMLTTEYYRYGYVEQLFAQCFLEQLKEKNILETEEYDSLLKSFTIDQQLFDGSRVAPYTLCGIFLSLVDTLILMRKIETPIRE